MSISVNGQPVVPPGFRFHPTEEELLTYYLKKKVASERIDLDVIRDVDLNKLEPWDIQERCRIGSGPQNDWYFFSHKDKKYPTGTRTNRATAAGFWKATGRDKAIYSSSNRIGMRKTLVFYKGRAPHGQKSDWIMHEYRLDDPSASVNLPSYYSSSSSSPMHGAAGDQAAQEERVGDLQGVQEEEPRAPRRPEQRQRRRRRDEPPRGDQTRRRHGEQPEQLLDGDRQRPGEGADAPLRQRRRARPHPPVHGPLLQAGDQAGGDVGGGGAGAPHTSVRQVHEASAPGAHRRRRRPPGGEPVGRRVLRRRRVGDRRLGHAGSARRVVRAQRRPLRRRVQEHGRLLRRRAQRRLLLRTRRRRRRRRRPVEPGTVGVIATRGLDHE